MNPNDDAVHGDGWDQRGQRAAEPVLDPAFGEASDKGLPRWSDKHRMPEGGEIRQGREEREIARIILAETDAGVEPDLLLGDAG